MKHSRQRDMQVERPSSKRKQFLGQFQIDHCGAKWGLDRDGGGRGG